MMIRFDREYDCERYAISADDLTSGESDFQRSLQVRLTASGHLGDVFPHMVSRNVPQFLLRRLWPELWESFSAEPHLMMFGAAEEGWGGRLDNVAARARRVGGTATDGDEVALTFRKTYVMDCASLLVLTRAAENPEEIVLAWLPREFAATASSEAGAAGARQTWTQRTEPGLSMSRSTGEDVHHYIVESGPECTVSTGFVLRLDRKRYASAAMQLGRREITSMSLLATATLRHHGLPVSVELMDLEEQVLAARDAAKLSGRHLELARQIFARFFRQTAEAGLPLHALWDRVKNMANQAR